MAKKKTVLKVHVANKKQQQKILSAVAKVSGVEKLDYDPTKGTLTVIGEVEPVPIFKALKKIKVTPEIVTVGPPKPPEPKCGPHCICTLCRPSCHSYPSTGPCPPMYRPYELVSAGYPLCSDYGSPQCCIM